MLATFFVVGDFLNVLNRSPTSQTCHQHIGSPTTVTNIDVTVFFISMLKIFYDYKNEILKSVNVFA